MTKEEFTEVKNKQLDRATEILGEHFCAYTIIVECDAHDESDATVTYLRYGGGFNTAFGLAARAVHRFEQLVDEQRNANDNEE